MQSSSLTELMREIERIFVKHGDMPVSVVVQGNSDNPIISAECVHLNDIELEKPVPTLLLFI